MGGVEREGGTSLGTEISRCGPPSATLTLFLCPFLSRWSVESSPACLDERFLGTGGGECLGLRGVASFSSSTTSEKATLVFSAKLLFLLSTFCDADVASREVAEVTDLEVWLLGFALGLVAVFFELLLTFLLGFLDCTCGVTDFKFESRLLCVVTLRSPFLTFLMHSTTCVRGDATPSLSDTLAPVVGIMVWLGGGVMVWLGGTDGGVIV